MRGKYDDMLYMPHHVSATRARMSAADRGAQFSPFAALVGYDAVIAETARLTQCRIELTEGEQLLLNDKLLLLSEWGEEMPAVSITYFCADEKKEGGAYVTASGVVKKIDRYGCCVQMADGRCIPMADMIAIEGDCFAEICRDSLQ